MAGIREHKMQLTLDQDYFRRQGSLNNLDKKRKTALAEQSAAEYTNLCIDLGFEPEDRFLYERGLADIIYFKLK